MEEPVQAGDRLTGGGSMKGREETRQAPGLRTVLRRLETLERKNRELEQRLSEIQSEQRRELVLCDDAGNVRVELAVREDGQTGLVLYDEHGTVRAALGVRKDGTLGLVLRDIFGEQRVELGILEDSPAGLVLYDDRGEARAVLHVSADGVPGLRLVDGEGEVIHEVPGKS